MPILTAGAMADEARDYADWRAKKLADPEIRAEFDALEDEYSAAVRRALCAGGNVVALSPPRCSVIISAEGGTAPK